MDSSPPINAQASTIRDPAYRLAQTVRDDQVQTMDWWASTPAEGYEGAPPPRLGAESFGELLRRQGLDPGSEGSGSRYQVEKVLGQGSGGTVWGVNDRRLSRTVAIKVLNRGGNRDGFVQEARIAASLQHPNVQPIYDLDVTGDGDPCFVMKRIAGVSLGEAMREVEEGTRAQAIPSIAGLVNVFIGVCQALAFAHHHGVIHQDIKPDNIMLGDFGEVLLVDWGCAVHGTASAGTLYGTPLYMAPEQARREFADARSDVYGLGATFFHALVGRAPTPPKADAQAFWARKRRGDIDAPSAEELQRVPPELIAIALKAIAAESAQRYASVEAMLADLRSYQAGLSVSAWREPLWHFMRRWYQLHRAQCWTAVVALLLVMAAGGLWWREKLRERSAWQILLQEDFRDSEQVAKRFRPVIFGADWAKPQITEIGLGAKAGVDLINGRLELGRDDQVVDVALRTQIFGNVRAEWTCTPLWNNLNLNCFIGDDRNSAYAFHVGGWGDPTYVALTKGSAQDLTVRATTHLDSPLVQGQSYRFRLEREGGLLRLFMDDRQLIEYDDPSDARVVAPQSLGFDAWINSRNAISDLRIWTRPLPERISPLDVGQQLAEAGNHTAALRHYRGLALAYAGKDLGTEAAFAAGFEALRANETPAGGLELQRLVTEHPRHVLAPYGWYTLAKEALARGDSAACKVAREALAAYPNHPVQKRVLFEIGIEHVKGFSPWLENGIVKSPDSKSHIVALVESVIADLDYWSHRYGRVVEDNSFLGDAAAVMIMVGRADLIVKHWPAKSRARADALIVMGRYDEVCAHWRHLDDCMQLVSTDMGKIQEAAGKTSVWTSVLQLELADDVDGLRRQFPYRDETANALMRAGRSAEVVADEKFLVNARARAMFVMGRMEDALALSTPDNTQLRAGAYIALNRIDQAKKECATELSLPAQIILHHLRQGNLSEATSLCDAMQAKRINMYSSWVDMSAISLLPLFMKHDAGQAVETQLAALLDDLQFCDGLRSWHLIAYALGKVDDAAFMAQPNRRDLDQALRYAKALRADFFATTTEAIAAWKDWQGAGKPGFGMYVIKNLVAWRLEKLAQSGKSSPDQPAKP